MKKRLPTQRLPLLSWLILPVVLAWIGTNYIIGSVRHPAWTNNQQNNNQNQVFGAQYETTIKNKNNWTWSGQGVVTLWFDDAWLNQYTVAFPALEKYNYKAALAVPTQVVGYEAYMNWTQIKRLQYAGWDISPHSKTHNCDLVDLPEKQVEEEIVGSKQDLLLHGISHDIYTAPCGKRSNIADSIIKQTFVASRNVESGFNTLPLTEFYNLKIKQVTNKTSVLEIESWIRQAVEQKVWLILMFHQIKDSPGSFDTTPFILESTLEALQKEKVEVVTPSQIINIPNNE